MHTHIHTYGQFRLFSEHNMLVLGRRAEKNLNARGQDARSTKEGRIGEDYETDVLTTQQPHCPVCHPPPPINISCRLQKKLFFRPATKVGGVPVCFLTIIIQEELVEAQAAGLFANEAVHVLGAVVVNGDGVFQWLHARLQTKGHLGVTYRVPGTKDACEWRLVTPCKRCTVNTCFVDAFATALSYAGRRVA